MSHCTLSEELLALHAGGDLAVAEAAEVEQHVLQCQHCATELAGFRAAREVLLDTREPLPASLGLWQEIEARLDVVDATTRIQRPWYAKYGLPGSIAAAAALVLGLQFMQGDGQNVGNTGLDQQSGSLAQSEAQDGEPLLTPRSAQDLEQLLLISPAFVDEGTEGSLVSVPANSKNF